MIMRRILSCGLLGLCLLLSSPLGAQTFSHKHPYEREAAYRSRMPKAEYRTPTTATRTRHTVPTLRLERTADMRMHSTGRYSNGIVAPAYQHYTIAQQQKPTTFVNIPAFGHSVWQGKVADMSGNLAVPHASKRRMGAIGGGDDGVAGNPEDVVLGGIGGGDDGLAGNPEYVPVGDMPVWLLVLLIGAYACCLRRKVRTAAPVRRFERSKVLRFQG